MSAAVAHEATKIVPGSQVTGSTSVEPCPRNIFVITSTSTHQSSGDIVRYGDHIVFTTLPEEGGEVSGCGLDHMTTHINSSNSTATASPS
jgi:hypothetical protein